MYGKIAFWSLIVLMIASNGDKKNASDLQNFIVVMSGLCFFLFGFVALVGFVARLFGIRTSSDDSHLPVPQDTRPSKRLKDIAPKYNFPIVGESFYQKNLKKLAGKQYDVDGPINKFFTARLVHDAENGHDEHAIAVIIENRLVGYIAREETSKLIALLQQNPGECPAMLTGGFIMERGKQERAFLGVLLSISEPAEFISVPNEISQAA